jgi:hypothetical protein
MIRALTVKQPWADLIAMGVKDVENRTWAPNPRAVGCLLLIHAGASQDRGAYSLPQVRAALPTGYTPVLGAVVATVRLAAVHRCDGGCSPWADPGVIHWQPSEVRRLAGPVPARGMLSLWTPEDDLVRAVTAGMRCAHP